MNKILHVEDEADIRAIARIALEEVGGFEVDAAESGEEALRKAEAWKPDLILLDVMMPGMDGPTTFQALRKSDRGASIPVIFMTAKVQSHEVDRYKAMGALGVLRKPFDPMTLADEIRKLWRQSGQDL